MAQTFISLTRKLSIVLWQGFIKLPLVAFLIYVAQRFYNDNCLHTAAALTYTTLLSIVPLLAVTLSILSGFPIFKEMGMRWQEYLLSNVVPASQEVIKDNLLAFVDKASHLTVLGVAFLIITALLLMESIDMALNRIWNAQRRRRSGAVFVIYWAVLSLGPLLLGGSIAATSYVFSQQVFLDIAHLLGDEKLILGSIPFVMNTLAFALIYVVVPNRSVPIVHGLIGGLIAAILFQIAKTVFSFYLSQFPNYELVYGTFAVIPIFLIWIYTSWVIILLGAEITRAFSSFQRDEGQGDACLPSHSLNLSFRLIGHLWMSQRQGKQHNLASLMRLEPDYREQSIEQVLHHLEAESWLTTTQQGHYVLIRDVHEITLLDLYNVLSGMLLNNEDNCRDNWDRTLSHSLQRSEQILQQTLRIPLVQLYQQSLVEKQN